MTIDTTNINKRKINGIVNELKSSRLLDEKVANDLLSSEAKIPQFKMLPKFTKRKILVDQWSVQLIPYYKDFKIH